MSKEHYICRGGCKGVSEHPGVCQDKECPNYGKPLEMCDCPNDWHKGAFDEQDEWDSIETH